MYFYCGKGSRLHERAKQKKRELLKKHPAAAHAVFDSETFSAAAMDALLESAGLFAGAHVVYCRNVSEHKEAPEYLKKRFTEIAASSHEFVFYEAEPPASLVALARRHAQKVEAVEGAPEQETRDVTPNLFSLGDALGARERRRAWVLYTETRARGSSPEEIFNVLFWQVKNILMVKQAESRGQASAATLGMKPFPFKKAKIFARHYETRELKELARELVEAFHESRYGGHELDLELEHFLLSL